MLRISRRRAGDTIPTSSLADIAFLLLIFFLVTTVFDEEKGLSLVLPPADSPVRVPPRNVLQLAVLPDGVIEVRHGAADRVHHASAADLPALWATAVHSNPDLIASVQTHPDAPYHRMVDVLDALRSAGAERISLQQLARVNR